MAELGSAALKGITVLAALGIGALGAGGSARAQAGGTVVLYSATADITASARSGAPVAAGTLSISSAGALNQASPVTIGGPSAVGAVGVITTAASHGRLIGINGAFAINTAGSSGGGPRFAVTANPPVTATLPPPSAVAPAPPATPQPVGRNPSLAINPALGVAPVYQRGITVREGGLVGLVGPSSAGHGVITATLDKVKIRGVEVLAVDLAGDGLLKLQVAPSVVDAHGQALSAQNRTAALTASAARDVVDGVTNARGRAAAHSVTREGGVIVFGGAPSN